MFIRLIECMCFTMFCAIRLIEYTCFTVFSKTDKHSSPSCLFCQWGELSNDQDDEIAIILHLAYFARGELSNDQDDEVGMVPPLAYFASGRNYAMIRMMKSDGSPSCRFCPW